jgi:hypothetical protein
MLNEVLVIYKVKYLWYKTMAMSKDVMFVHLNMETVNCSPFIMIYCVLIFVYI